MRLRTFFRGCGEMVAAVGAAAVAIGELIIGRWPSPDRMDRPPKPPKLGPYPIND